MKRRIDAKFITATGRWREEKVKQKGERKTARSIVHEINSVHGTNFNKRTVRVYANCYHTDVPMTGHSKKSIINESAELALNSAVLSYIQLSNVGMNKTPNHKHIIHQMKLCLNSGDYQYKRYDHLYDWIMRIITDKVDGSGDNYTMEQRRLS